MLARAFAIDIPPVTLAFVRWLLALSVLLPFVAHLLWRHRQQILEHWKLLSLYGLLSVASFNTLAYKGLQTTTALNGTLLQSSMPIMILIINALFMGKHATLKQWAGVLISLAGVIFLISRGDWQVLLQLDMKAGDLWVLSALLIWAIYSVLLQKKPEGLTPLALLGALVIVGVMALAPLSYWEMQHLPAIQWNSQLYLLVVFLALFPSLLAYLFWNRGVAELGAAKAGLFIHLVPVWGMVLSTLFLGEQVHAFHLVGIGLIFSGIYLAVISDTFGFGRQTITKE